MARLLLYARGRSSKARTLSVVSVKRQFNVKCSATTELHVHSVYIRWIRYMYMYSTLYFSFEAP